MTEETKESASNPWATDAIKRAAGCFACQTRERSEWCTLVPEEVRQLNAAKTRNAYRGGVLDSPRPRVVRDDPLG
jgi:hypothetical protein